MVATLLIIGLRALLLFLFWVLLSAKLDIFHLSIGLLCSLFISYSSYSPSPKSKASFNLLLLLSTTLKSFRYVAWLLGRVFFAAIHVSKLVYSPKLVILPSIYKHQTKLKNENARVVFANSITLTPGTITADISGDELTIHQIDDDSSGDITSGEMENQIQKIFTKGNKK